MPPKAMRAVHFRHRGRSQCTADRRDVLVEPLRHLVAVELWIDGVIPRHRRTRHCSHRHLDRLDELSRPAVLLAVGDEELFQRQPPFAIGAIQHQRRAERNQRRRHVADWRAVGDVATDGAGVSNLHRADPPHQFAERGIVPTQHLDRRRIGDRRADPQQLAILSRNSSSSGTRAVETSTGRRRCCLVTHRPISVAPPSSWAVGCRRRMSISSARLVGA